MNETEALRRRVTELEDRVAALDVALSAEGRRTDRNLKETMRIVSEVAGAVGIRIEVEGGIQGENQIRRKTE